MAQYHDQRGLNPTEELLIGRTHMSRRLERRSILRFVFSGAASVVLLPFASLTYAATLQFKADLKGSSEVPPAQTTGAGTVTVTFDQTTKRLTWNGTYSGLTGPATGAHFHGPAEPGRNAGVALTIRPATSPFMGSATLTDAQATDLIAGRWYVNIHTNANEGGELRGQLVKM
jgi:CHRD domain